MITLAFYKGRGETLGQRMQDAVICLVTRGRYSHVELISGRAQHGHLAHCFSSSGRDGGVREKPILLSHNNWDLVELNLDPTAPTKFISDRIGAKYDYSGILLSQFLAFGRHNPDKWFCSEICAAALGFPNPQRVSPQFLFDVVTWNSRD